MTSKILADVLRDIGMLKVEYQLVNTLEEKAFIEQELEKLYIYKRQIEEVKDYEML